MITRVYSPQEFDVFLEASQRWDQAYEGKPHDRDYAEDSMWGKVNGIWSERAVAEVLTVPFNDEFLGRRDPGWDLEYFQSRVEVKFNHLRSGDLLMYPPTEDRPYKWDLAVLCVPGPQEATLCIKGYISRTDFVAKHDTTLFRGKVNAKDDGVRWLVDPLYLTPITELLGVTA